MQNNTLRVLATCAGLVLAGFLFAPGAAADQSQGKSAIKVMTYNVNEGTDFQEVLEAQTFPDFLSAVQLTLNNVKATDPPLRMQAIAHQIAITQPDLVGLQEVTTWRLGPGPNPAPVLFDMLQELLSALAEQGEHYTPVVVVREFDLQAPLPDLTTYLEAADSDVILARAGEDALQLSNVQSAHFASLLTLPTFIGPFTILQGWGSVDVRLHGQSLRFIVTHLANFIPQLPPTVFVQQTEVAELVSGPANTALPVIIAGDFNADADNPVGPTFGTYEEMIGFGFRDAWESTHPGEPGFTWGQLPDSSNVVSQLTQRIDFIFFRGQLHALNSRLAGAATHDRIDGLWPSDHAGLRATLLVGTD
jgi:endonuclease/exonuclease/phosphatase family metal-dependent hydrolase